jgi:hypothetical protein
MSVCTVPKKPSGDRPVGPLLFIREAGTYNVYERRQYSATTGRLLTSDASHPSHWWKTSGMLCRSGCTRWVALHEDVIEAVREGKFHVYPVRTIDEGIALLTGVSAGDRSPDGAYPDGSVNFRVLKRLGEMAEQSRAFRGEGDSVAVRGDSPEGFPAFDHPRPE